MPDFKLDDAAAVAIVEICQRLDGIALAIEMAAPRLLVLTPKQFAERLHERFRLLARGPTDVLPRQRTLRTMFDWSWGLLSPAERDLLQHIGVFSAGATIAALEASRDDDSSDWATLEQLTSLVEIARRCVVGRDAAVPAARDHATICAGAAVGGAVRDVAPTARRARRSHSGAGRGRVAADA